ncbi:MAG: ferrochelatase [Acidobacteriaceae bacterium]
MATTTGPLAGMKTAETHMPTPRRAVLLLAHGSPDTIAEIPEYLRNVLSGRALPQPLIEEVQRRYALIGKSPLTEWTLQQAALLQQTLSLPVYVGMRNWRPYIADTVRQMRADGVTEAVAICLAPQNSRTSVGLYRRATFAEVGDTLRIYFHEDWAEHPRLIDAFADRLRPVWSAACKELGAKVPVLFTAHSVPVRTVQAPQPQPVGPEAATTPQTPPGRPASATSTPVRPTLPERSYAAPASAPQGPDTYPDECKRTAALVAERLSSDGLEESDCLFAFQSQAMSGGPWIGPTVEETLQKIKDEGHAGVVLQTIGFLCDHVEILYDIDIAFKGLAEKIGLKLWRPESLNASPLLIAALADLAQEGLRKLDAPTGAVHP